MARQHLAQVREGARACAALKLQAWWRGVLALRSRAGARLAAEAASFCVRRAAYASYASSPGCPTTTPRPPVGGDEELLREAILVAEGERAAAAAALLPIMLGLGRAIRCIRGADGKAPSCPGGHLLIAAHMDPGSQCDCCLRVAERACIAIVCDDPCCSFISCARQATCAPLSIVRVLKALQIKFAVADLSFDKDAG